MIARSHPPEPSWFTNDEKTILRQAEIKQWLDDPRRGLFRRPVWEDIEDFLDRFRLLFDNKCVYCEISLDNDSQAKVNFFRPDGNARQERENPGESDKHHYRWLTWDWRNLYLACSECSRSKGAIFPTIDRQRVILGAHNVQLDHESILLLDPCDTTTNPLSYLLFQEDGTVSSRGGMLDRGAITIEVLDLNRLSLVAARAAEIKQLKKFWEGVTAAGRISDPRPINYIALLQEEYADNVQFVGMKRQLLYRWCKENPIQTDAWKSLFHRLEYWNSDPPPRSSSPSTLIPTSFEQGYALLIGVGMNRYDRQYSLPETVNDVQALYEILCNEKYCAYPSNQIQLLQNELATRQGILDGLAWLAEQATHKDATAIIFFSGYGLYDQQYDQYHLIPHDCNPHQVNLTALSSEDFCTGVAAIPAKNILVLLDCCPAESIVEGQAMQLKALSSVHSVATPLKFIRQLYEGEGRAVISSSRSQEVPFIQGGNRNSFFIAELLKALTGAVIPSDKTRMVHLFALADYICKQVSRRATDLGVVQTLVFGSASVTNFPIALLNGGKSRRKQNFGSYRKR